MILTNDQKPQEKREPGEPTGFADNGNTPIRVGDFMTIAHWCNCEFCNARFRCQVLWNDEWSAYGLLDENGIWQSGMGIAGGFRVEPNAANEPRSDSK